MSTADWFDFPPSEYARRIAVAQEAMSGTELDALFLTQKQNIEYFSGFMTTHWGSRTFPTAGMVIPYSGEPILVVSDFLQETARSTSPVESHATFPNPHAKPDGFVDAVVEAIHSVGFARSGCLGVETGYQMMGQWSISDFQALRERLPAMRLLSADPFVWAARSQKSTDEIERIEWLSQLTARALGRVLATAEPGMTEVDLARGLLVDVVQAGADGLSHLNIRCGPERYGMRDSLPQHRQIQSGETLLVNAGASFHGYMSDVGSTRVIGDSRLYTDDFQIMTDAQQAGLARVEIGVAASDVFSSVNHELRRSRLRSIAMCGHGMGVAFHEPPVLRPGNDETIRDCMVLALES
ncbi:MAG: Xaa-Pro peptidase family protein, partial [Acidimicrobiia bacterium]